MASEGEVLALGSSVPSSSPPPSPTQPLQCNEPFPTVDGDDDDEVIVEMGTPPSPSSSSPPHGVPSVPVPRPLHRRGLPTSQLAKLQNSYSGAALTGGSKERERWDKIAAQGGSPSDSIGVRFAQDQQETPHTPVALKNERISAITAQLSAHPLEPEKKSEREKEKAAGAPSSLNNSQDHLDRSTSRAQEEVAEEVVEEGGEVPLRDAWVALLLLVANLLYYLLFCAVPMGMRLALERPDGFRDGEDYERSATLVACISACLVVVLALALIVLLCLVYVAHTQHLSSHTRYVQIIWVISGLFCFAVVATQMGMCLVYHFLWDLEMYRIFRHDVTPLGAYQLETCGRVIGAIALCGATIICLLRCARKVQGKQFPYVRGWDFWALLTTVSATFLLSLLAGCIPSCLRVKARAELPSQLQEEGFRSPSFAHQTEFTLLAIGSALVAFSTFSLAVLTLTLTRVRLFISHKNAAVILLLLLFVGMVLEVAGRGLLLADLRGNELVGNRNADIAEAFRIEKVGVLLGPFLFYAAAMSIAYADILHSSTPIDMFDDDDDMDFPAPSRSDVHEPRGEAKRLRRGTENTG